MVSGWMDYRTDLGWIKTLNTDAMKNKKQQVSTKETQTTKRFLLQKKQFLNIADVVFELEKVRPELRYTQMVKDTLEEIEVNGSLFVKVFKSSWYCKERSLHDNVKTYIAMSILRRKA
jgi:hypothetical protein